MTTSVPENPGTGEAAEDHIEVRALTKTYPGSDRPALTGVDLRVPRRRFVSLIGPSGCGKSTLLRVLAGLTEPDEGQVDLFGSAPRRMCRAKAVGLVPQTPALLPWASVRRNVALPGRVNRRTGRGVESADDLLHSVGLAHAAHSYPHQLSGGMRQRVAIARAFALRPELLLMDEPFSALDEFTREALQMRLLDLWQRRSTTVVFVTHSVQEAVALSDEIVVMAPGHVHETVSVDLPRPRDTDAVSGPRANEIAGTVRAELRQAWNHSTLPDAPPAVGIR